MIEIDKRSTNRNNKSRAQVRAGIQEETVEEFLALMQQPLFNKVLRKPDEKTKIIKHPVSTNKKKKEPDYVIIYSDEKGNQSRPVIVEVKSSLNSTKKVDRIIAKYMNTSYLNKKAKHLVVFSFSSVPQKVIDKIERLRKGNKNFKIHLVTPEMMQEVLERNKKIKLKEFNEKRQHKLENIQEERRKTLENFEKFMQKKYQVEGFEKALLTARNIARRNQIEAKARELNKINKYKRKPKGTRDNNRTRAKNNKQRGRRR